MIIYQGSVQQNQDKIHSLKMLILVLLFKIERKKKFSNIAENMFDA